MERIFRDVLENDWVRHTEMRSRCYVGTRIPRLVEIELEDGPTQSLARGSSKRPPKVDSVIEYYWKGAWRPRHDPAEPTSPEEREYRRVRSVFRRNVQTLCDALVPDERKTEGIRSVVRGLYRGPILAGFRKSVVRDRRAPYRREQKARERADPAAYFRRRTVVRRPIARYPRSEGHSLLDVLAYIATCLSA